VPGERAQSGFDPPAARSNRDLTPVTTPWPQPCVKSTVASEPNQVDTLAPRDARLQEVAVSDGRGQAQQTVARHVSTRSLSVSPRVWPRSISVLTPRVSPRYGLDSNLRVSPRRGLLSAGVSNLLRMQVRTGLRQIVHGERAQSGFDPVAMRSNRALPRANTRVVRPQHFSTTRRPARDSSAAFARSLGRQTTTTQSHSYIRRVHRRLIKPFRRAAETSH
jgi:hypothetical protein